MTIFFLVVFGSYFCFVLFLLYGWELSLSKPVTKAESYRSITVIIPIRNEEANIDHLSKSLSDIRYPKEKVEFIFVNDHSSDKSVELLGSIPLTNQRVLQLQDGQTGKKAAITKGVEQSSSQIIVTTDADCTHDREWLETINSTFADSQINMVVGGVTIKGDSLWGRMQSIEFLSLIGSGASLLKWRIPAMANGANLAYQRNIFFDVEGYAGNDRIPSGDDEYLLRKVFNRSSSGVVFNHHPNSVVVTNPLPNLSSFLQQRIRWASKWKFQTSWKVKGLSLLVFLFQCTFIAAFVLYFIAGSKLLLILLLSKAALEAIFLFRVGQFLRVRLSLIPFVLVQIFYPIYVVITAIGSLFLAFEWKDRKY